LEKIQTLFGGVMITSAGALCDVCDKYILLDKSVNPFKVTGCDTTLHCHDKCKQILLDGDYTKLPDGRLKRSFERTKDNE